MSTRAQWLARRSRFGWLFPRYTRIMRLQFPTFSYGRYAKIKDRAASRRFPSSDVVGQVHIDPGDWVLGDVDGVCVIPKKAEEEAFVKAIEKARGEKLVQKALQAGMSAVEAFAKYKIM